MEKTLAAVERLPIELIQCIAIRLESAGPQPLARVCAVSSQWRLAVLPLVASWKRRLCLCCSGGARPKVILLGTALSGKTTLIKRVLWHDAERSAFRTAVRRHLAQAVLALLRECCWQLSTASSSASDPAESELGKALQASEDLVADHPSWPTAELDETQVAFIEQLFAAAKRAQCASSIADGVNRGLSSPNAFDLVENTRGITRQDYVPSLDDALRTYVRTTGLVNYTLPVCSGRTPQSIDLVDVGGKRLERRKWIHVFDCVDVVAFVVALDCYTETLPEDASSNRMVDALDCFGAVCAHFHRASPSTATCLLLNRYDVLCKQLRVGKSPCELWPEFTGAVTDPAAVVEFIREKFESRACDQQRVFSHLVPCALEREGPERLLPWGVLQSLTAHRESIGYDVQVDGLRDESIDGSASLRLPRPEDQDASKSSIGLRRLRLGLRCSRRQPCVVC
jgi:predicted kinase